MMYMHLSYSGYIPSSVYTRNQYRTQHFPTLSTRHCRSLQETAPQNTQSQSVSCSSTMYPTSAYTSTTNINVKSDAIVSSSITNNSTTCVSSLDRHDNDKLPHSETEQDSNVDIGNKSSESSNNSPCHILSTRLYCTNIEDDETVLEISDSVTFDVRGHSSHNLRRESRSVPRELDPSSLAYEANLDRDPLNLSIDTSNLCLDPNKLSFPGGLYNIPQQRSSSLVSHSLTRLNTTSSPPLPPPTNNASPYKTSKVGYSPQHHPHHYNHLPHHRSGERVDRSAPPQPPPLLASS